MFQLFWPLPVLCKQCYLYRIIYLIKQSPEALDILIPNTWNIKPGCFGFLNLLKKRYKNIFYFFPDDIMPLTKVETKMNSFNQILCVTL